MLRVVRVLVVLVLLGWGYLALVEALAPGEPLVLRPHEPLVSSGTAVVMLCGEEKGFMRATEHAPDSRVGSWSSEKRVGCNVWYHHPEGPGAD